jgi:HEAT repeat protein
MLDESDPAVRKEAITAAGALLERVDPPAGGGVGRVDGRAVDPASSALREPGTPLDEKIELVKLLGKTGAARAQGVLLPLVTAKQPSLRLAAIDALGSLGTSSPVVDAALLKALDDESSDARLRAATSIARIGGAPVAKQLLERLAVSAEQDRGAIGIALSGTLARATDASLATAAEKAVETAPEAARDGLIEGLGRMRGEAAATALTNLAARGIDDRRKVAEAVAGHAELAAVARKLAVDPDAGVRANAIWSLGAIGGRGDVPLLARALKDVDAAVAGDAAAAIGRVAVKERDAGSATPLCSALSDARPYVRANAILGLSMASASCDSAPTGPRPPGSPELRPHEAFPSAADLVVRDPSEAVRLAAATALARDAARTGPAAALAARALVRCAAEDHDAAVATRCSRPVSAIAGVDDVSVYVVADGRAAPQPRGAFALERADGLLRLGVADRRGSFFEAAAPRGAIRLAVPAPLAR